MNKFSKTSERSQIKNFYLKIVGEFKKAVQITRKLLSASKTTSSLNEAYRELGVLLSESLKKQELIWDHPKVNELIKIIDRYHSDLLVFEEQVYRIRWETNHHTPSDGKN